MKKPRSSVWRALRVALLALLVVAIGCQDSTGKKLGSFVPGGGSSGTTAATVVAFSADILLTGNTTTTWTGGATEIILTHKQTAAGNVDKAMHRIVVPANTATNIALPTSVNPKGAFAVDANRRIIGFDPTVPHALLFVREGAQTFLAALTAYPVAEAAPTITGVTCSAGNPDAVVVAFSDLVDIRSVAAGWTMTSAGGRTITAIEAGDGTNAVTLTVSSAFVGSETPTLVVGAGQGAKSLNGIALANTSHAITMNFATGVAACAAWDKCFDGDAQLAPTSGAFTSWTDQVSHSAQLLLHGGGTAPTVGNHAITFTGNTAQRLEIAAALSSGTGFSIYIREANPTYADGGYTFAFDGNGSVDNWVTSNNYYQADIFGVITNAGPGTSAQVTAISGGAAYHDVFYSRPASSDQWTVQVDDMTPVTVTNAKAVSSLTMMALNAPLLNGSPSGLGASACKVRHFAMIANRAWIGGEVAAIRAHTAGTPDP